MIEIGEVNVTGWENAIRGMRNPMNSWSKSDSVFEKGYFEIGENDLELMRKLVKAGTDHGKFMRFINVYMDINAPLYWWKEFDTYKVGTVANSCSTMHKITEKEFDLENFSIDKIIDTREPEYEHMRNDVLLTLHFDGERQYYDPYDIYCEILIPALNLYRKKYLETKQKEYWWQMIQLLPSSYNQKRTVMLNYAVLRNMYHARKNHKLDEWRKFCAEIERLPYSELITRVK